MSTRNIKKIGGRIVRAWWFWAFVLLVIPNCTLDTSGYCVPNEPCPADDCPNAENPKCDKPPCPDPDNPECEQPPVCPDPDNPECEQPPVCPDPNNPECPMPPVTVFDQGPDPASDAIMCDFPAPVDPAKSECASAAEAADPNNLLLTQAATGLATTRNSSIGLDFSAAATQACGNNLPKKITYLGTGPFPDGNTVCINFAQQIPNVFATPAKACIAKCEDVINMGNGFKPANVHDYCVSNAKTSTNYAKDDFIGVGACTAGGNAVMNFPDPRRPQEKVIWTDFIGTAAGAGSNANSLTRTAPTTVPTPDFDAGAASTQTIASGDAWVEFDASILGANETTLSHVIGVRASVDSSDVPCYDVSNCVDMDPGYLKIGFAIDLASDGGVYTIQTGGPGSPEILPFGSYAAGERFRVKVIDNHDGSATLSAVRIVGACVVGTACTETPIATSAINPKYPLRVDATFREQNATVANVTIVRIKP